MAAGNVRDNKQGKHVLKVRPKLPTEAAGAEGRVRDSEFRLQVLRARHPSPRVLTRAPDRGNPCHIPSVIDLLEVQSEGLRAWPDSKFRPGRAFLWDRN